MILDEDIAHTWSTIINSVTQMPYDAVKYKSKSNNNSCSEASKLNYTTTTTTNIQPASDTNENESVQQCILLN